MEKINTVRGWQHQMTLGCLEPKLMMLPTSILHINTDLLNLTQNINKIQDQALRRYGRSKNIPVTVKLRVSIKKTETTEKNPKIHYKQKTSKNLHA